MTDELEAAWLVAAAGLGGTALGLAGNYLTDLGRTRRERRFAREDRLREATYGLQAALDEMASAHPTANDGFDHFGKMLAADTFAARTGDAELIEKVHTFVERVDETRKAGDAGPGVDHLKETRALHDEIRTRIRRLIHDDW